MITLCYQELSSLFKKQMYQDRDNLPVGGADAEKAKREKAKKEKADQEDRERQQQKEEDDDDGDMMEDVVSRSAFIAFVKDVDAQKAQDIKERNDFFNQMKAVNDAKDQKLQALEAKLAALQVNAGGSVVTDWDYVATNLGKAVAANLPKSTPKAREQQAPTLEKTDALGWRTFRNNFELTKKINTWTDQISVLKLMTSLKGEAALSVEHLDFTTYSPVPTLNEALDEYERIFVNPSGMDMSEIEFHQSSKKADETLLQWHTRVRSLFARAFPQEDLSTAKRLKDHFTLNIRNKNLTFQLRTSPQYRDYNYGDLLLRAQDVAASFLLCKEAYTNNSISPIVAAMPPPTEAAARCHFCNNIGHHISHCSLYSSAIERISKRPENYGLKSISASDNSSRSHRTGGGGGNRHRGRSSSAPPSRGSGTSGGPRGRGRGRGTSGGRPGNNSVTSPGSNTYMASIDPSAPAPEVPTDGAKELDDLIFGSSVSENY